MTLPVAWASGGPRERGLAIGEAPSDPINRSVAFLRRFLEPCEVPFEEVDLGEVA